MKSIESSPRESEVREKTDKIIHELLDGPPSNNYNYRQMQLAVEKFVVEHPETTLDHNKLDEIMMKWADSASSKGFSKIAWDPQFKTHPRFQGDIARITLEDVEYYIGAEKMPK